MSTNPGMIVFPVTSMDVVPAGMFTLPDAPTDTMRLLVTSTSPRSMTSSPFMVMMRALRSTTLPTGRSFGTVIVASNRVAAYAGPLGRGVPGARLAANAAESRTAESPLATSYTKNEWPNE